MWKVKSDHEGGVSGEEHDGMAKMENGEMGVMAGRGGGQRKGSSRKLALMDEGRLYKAGN